MSRPRFLADNDLKEQIIDGLLRREPAISLMRCRELGLRNKPDAEVLTYAHEQGLIVISHDVNTMPAAAYARIGMGQHIAGLLMVRQASSVVPIIDNLMLIWSSSDAEEWRDVVAFLPL
jgi:predicted nuclease of predicted toxin-antitoxin system